MAWEFNSISIGVGEFSIIYRFGGSGPLANGGEDRGAQFAMAHTIEGAGGKLFVTEQGKSNVDGHSWLYHVKGYNAGPYAVHCKFQGGGLT